MFCLSRQSVPKLTDWDFGILVVILPTALPWPEPKRTHLMKPTHKTKQRSLWGHPVDNHKINGCQKSTKKLPK